MRISFSSLVPPPPPLFVLVLLFAGLVFGDAFKLYLKEGGYQAVREYAVQGERVHYFSTERGEWEDIPAELVDLERTEKERKAQDAAAGAAAQEESDEAKALRQERKEIAAIPGEPGAYYRVGGKIDTLVTADYQVVTSKKRKTLQILSPVPLVPGRASVVVKGERAEYVIHEARPHFYLRMEREERFGIVTLTPKKGVRVVENISVMPVAGVANEERKQMETFERDLGGGLFEIWPVGDLADGEYGLVEFLDGGDVNDLGLVVWGFGVVRN